jgi:hypothetical protein
MDPAEDIENFTVFVFWSKLISQTTVSLTKSTQQTEEWGKYVYSRINPPLMNNILQLINNSLQSWARQVN